MIVLVPVVLSVRTSTAPTVGLGYADRGPCSPPLYLCRKKIEMLVMKVTKISPNVDLFVYISIRTLFAPSQRLSSCSGYQYHCQLAPMDLAVVVLVVVVML